MVKYTVAASVAIIQLAMLAQTSVALPIEYAEGLESRAISSPNGQQLTERDDMELEVREPLGVGHVVAGVAGAFAAIHYIPKLWHHLTGKEGAQGNPQGNPQGSSQDPSNPQSQRRDLSGIDLDARDWDEFEKRHVTTLASQQETPNRRDLSDLHERDWDEYEKRSLNDFEERDWNELEERDWDDYELEARGLNFDELDELD